MTIIIKGIIPDLTILFVKFSALNVSATKCTSSSTYLRDAEKFASQFKKEKDVIVTMEILHTKGKEKV